MLEKEIDIIRGTNDAERASETAQQPHKRRHLNVAQEQDACEQESAAAHDKSANTDQVFDVGTALFPSPTMRLARWGILAHTSLRSTSTAQIKDSQRRVQETLRSKCSHILHRQFQNSLSETPGRHVEDRNSLNRFGVG
jgi:hypothetical protein